MSQKQAARRAYTILCSIGTRKAAIQQPQLPHFNALAVEGQVAVIPKKSNFRKKDAQRRLQQLISIAVSLSHIHV
jgi:hypothetical protein